jgi:hypothetical protein
MQHTDCALVAEEDLLRDEDFVHSAVCLVPLMSYIEEDEINLAHCSMNTAVVRHRGVSHR